MGAAKHSTMSSDYQRRVLREELRAQRATPLPGPPAASGGHQQRNIRLDGGTLAASQIAQYNADGYLGIEQLLPEGQLAQLRDEATDCWLRIKGADNFRVDNSWLQNSLLPNVHHHSAAVRQYYWAGPLVPLMQQLIGDNVKACTSQLTFKLKGNVKDFDWHHDNAYGHLRPYNAISCLLALDDVTIQNGCLRILPGSHHLGQAQGEEMSLADKIAEKSVHFDVQEEGMPVRMKAGDALIFHCHMVHRSMGNKSEIDRRILYCRYADADAVEVYNGDKPRLGRVVAGSSQFDEVNQYETELPAPGV